MTNLFFFLTMFCAGITIAVQPSINARLAQRVGVLESSCISFAVGTLALLVLVLLTGKGSFRGLVDATWWEWTGGLLGATFVTATIVVVPRIGTAAAMSAVIAAQLITGIALDQVGAFGMRVVPVDAKRVIGALLLLAGAALIKGN
ncbi:DMT family transporter [Geomesophilobacter sediminis]|uniref:DMT family transporter n=1 Tax=Geomesophilobacter sediminis TaxID=2798584 RepID=A0A8J7LU99_9BACT|nr:DMT family transporter [Geomesophilobacter sediminis]MBJ6724409.1 DMT family transporter [Geomesophilobacter sediminis]